MNRLRCVLPIGVTYLLSVGCATVEAVTGPDGSQHQLVSCGSVKYCYDKAREVCGGNYQIVNTSNSVSGNAESTSSQIQLLVKCDSGSRP
jgi:hypothetical protein